jgi:hypothetical protein
MVVPARAIPNAARKVPLARRRALDRAPFVFAEPAFELVLLAVFVFVAVGVEDADVLFVEFALTARLLFPMVDVVVHEDVAGAGCGGGVAGSPW